MLSLEKFGLPPTEQFASTLIRIADYAFSYGKDSIPDGQRQKSPTQWTSKEMDDFMSQCRVGFKLAQKELIEHILFYQEKLEENKQEVKASRSAHNKNKTEEYLAVAKVIGRRLHNLSHIADGLVIQILGEQVHIARRLHIGEKSSKQLKHSNLEHAIKVSDQLNEDPDTFALISDLTSFVQIGDLLVTDKKKGLYISELKEGKTNERIREFIDYTLENGMPCPGFQSDFSEKEHQQMQRMLRQDLRAQQAVEVINTDKGTDSGTGAEIVVNTPTIDLIYYDGIFQKMIGELEEKNWSYRLVEDCVHIGFYKGETAPAMAKFTIPHILKKQSEDYLVIEMMQITEEVSETLFAKPLPREFVVKLMTGQVKGIIGINLNELIKVFNANGLKTDWLSKKETAKMKNMANKIPIITSKSRAIGIELPTGECAVMSGGIISKIAFDNILPSSLAASMATAKAAQTGESPQK